MTEQWIFILAMTCVAPAAAGVAIYKKIDRIFKPAVYILVLSVIAELLIKWSLLYNKPLVSGNLITNIFLLLNTSLYIYLFYSLQVLRGKFTALFIFLVFLIAFLFNAYYAGSVNKFYFYASLICSIIILFMAVEGITIQTFRSKEKWSSDFIFLFCIITVIYNANAVFFFSITLIGMAEGELYRKILDIYKFINAACNLLYVWPILCIPRNRSYIKLF